MRSGQTPAGTGTDRERILPPGRGDERTRIRRRKCLVSELRAKILPKRPQPPQTHRRRRQRPLTTTTLLMPRVLIECLSRFLRCSHRSSDQRMASKIIVVNVLALPNPCLKSFDERIASRIRAAAGPSQVPDGVCGFLQLLDLRVPGRAQSWL